MITAATQIEVSGTVSPQAVSVDVTGVAATLDAGSFSAAVPLDEGNNLLIAVARDADGNMGTATIQVTRDTAPPRVLIGAPADGETLGESSVTVAGAVHDIVVGTVNQDQATVTVNGVATEVANRSFLAPDVPLSPGVNVVTATATDQVGNSASTSLTVTFEPPTGEPRIRTVSGTPQTAVIGETLPQPLVVELLDADGAPAVGEMVIFKVVQNDGLLTAGGDPSRSVATVTDASGPASVQWTLGTRAGSGNHRVEARAVGFGGAARFAATGLAAAPAKISVDSGLNQSGLVNQPLPLPFVVVVTDAGHNRLEGVAVTFIVTAGGSGFDGAASQTVATDEQGVARAVLTLGPEAGIENNRVEVDFAGNSGLPAVFTASAGQAGDPGATRISGVVLDNTDRPIEGVTLTLAETGQETRSDPQGQFFFHPAPVGLVHLRADGSTAQRPGSWPTLEYQLVTTAGRDNALPRPVYLLPLDLPNGLEVDENQGGVLILPGIPGFALTIAPGSATFPDGSRSGLVSVTVVHADKVPRVPNFGQQPRLVVTIQPAGVRFDPPAALTLPNVDGLAPGQVTELYSFDHDLGQFVAIGTGTVSDDGAVIRSDPGVGILEGGWHCGGDPAPTAGAENAHVELTVSDPLMLIREETSIVTALGGPEPGVYEWSSSDASVAEIVSPASGSGVDEITLLAADAGVATITVAFECRSGARDETVLQVEVVSVDLDMTGVDDAVEESEGGLLTLNDDDDNGNGQEDRDEPGPVAGEDNLREITLEVEQTGEDAQITLEATAGGARIRVWESASKGSEVTLPVTYARPSEVPASLFVEGIATSATPGETMLRLTLQTQQLQETDTVRLGVFDVEIVQPEDEAVFEIESTPLPEMPEITARAELRGVDPAQAETTPFEWTVQLRSHFAENLCVNAVSQTFDLDLGPVSEIGGVHMPDFGDLIRGGDLTLIVKVTLDGQTVEDRTEDVEIHGENPPRPSVQELLPHDVLKRIACHESSSSSQHRAHPESGQRQFDAAAEAASECPLFGFGNLGTGIMQLSVPAPDADETWDWFENLRTGAILFENEKVPVARRFPARMREEDAYEELVEDFNRRRAEKGMENLTITLPDFTESGFDAEPETLGQLERDSIRGYNGFLGRDPLIDLRGTLHEFRVAVDQVDGVAVLRVVNIDEEQLTGEAVWETVPLDQRPQEIGDPDYVNNVLARSPECNN